MKKGILSLVVGSTLILGVLSQAGTVLKLHNGSFDPRQKAAVLSESLALRPNAPQTQDEFIVQYKNIITEADKNELKALGAHIYKYLPEDALIVRLNAQSAVKVQNLDSVRALISYKGDFKLSDNLPPLNVFSQNKRNLIHISLFEAADADKVMSDIKALDVGARLVQASGKNLIVVVEQTALASFQNLSGVEFVEKVESISPMYIDLMDDTQPTPPAANGDYKDLTGYETGTKIMGLDTAWAAGYNGNNQTVAIADTGLDVGNTDTILADFKDAVKAAHSFGIGATTWEDPMGHGTHVAGSVAGRGTNSGGLLKGVAYGAQIVFEGMWSPLIDNLTVPPSLNTLFDAAYTDGARIHTNSWGSGSTAYDGMAAQVDQFMWDHPDFLIVFAAGNSGVDKNGDGVIDPGSVSSPGTAKNALTVGASKNLVATGGIQKPVSELRGAKDSWSAEPIWSSKLSDNPNGMAMFSSRGPTPDGRIKPEIVAPGTNILSTRSQNPKSDLLWGAYNDKYLWCGGTSMSTPLTAGASAVARQILVEKYKFENPSAALVKAFLVHTAFDMYPGQFGEGTPTQELKHRPNGDEGYGRVDLDKATKANVTQIVDNTTGVGVGEKYEAQVQVAQGQNLLVNLVYTDAPGAEAAAQALVNQLDIKVNGQGDEDKVNNTKMTDLKNLAAGTYTISVIGTNVPMGKNGKQPFALIYSVY